MADHSTHITIQTSELTPQLTTLVVQMNSGEYDPMPPLAISPGSVVNYSLRDHDAPNGSNGLEEYYAEAEPRWALALMYACPYEGPNAAHIFGGDSAFLVDWYGQTNDDGNWRHASIPKSGHPLRLFVAIRAASEPVVPPPKSTG